MKKIKLSPKHIHTILYGLGITFIISGFIMLAGSPNIGEETSLINMFIALFIGILAMVTGSYLCTVADNYMEQVRARQRRINESRRMQNIVISDTPSKPDGLKIGFR